MTEPVDSGGDGTLLKTIIAECSLATGALREGAVLKRLKEVSETGARSSAEMAGRKLIERDPGLLRVTAFLADLAREDGRKREAADLYQRALTSAGAGEPSVLRALAYTLDDLRHPAEQVDRAFRAAIVANPHDRSLLGRWINLLNRLGQDDRAAFAALQATTETLLGSVVTTLVERHVPIDALEAPFQERIAHFRESEAFQAVDAVWSAFSRLERLDGQVRERAMPHFGAATTLTFLLRQPAIRRVSVDLRKPSPTEVDSELAIDVAAIKSYCNETFLGLDSDPWLAFLENEADCPTDAGRATVIARDMFCVWQERAVERRSLRFLHPVDKTEVEAVDAFIYSGRTVYTFPGSTPFLLIAGGGGSKILAIFLPAFNCLIDLGAAIGSAIADYPLANLFSLIARRLCDQADLYNATIGRKQAGETTRRVCLAINTAQNFAHHLWNYYPALERLVRAGIADHVDEIYFAGSQFFGSVEALFPEFTNARYIEYRRGALDPHPFSSDHLLLQPGGYFIPRTLRERLIHAMAARPPIDSAQAEPHFAGERPFPIVWIGLRLGDKSWADQEVAAAAFIDRIGQAHPGALFLLDGFSYPIGIDDSSAGWSATITALKAVTRTIRARCGMPDRVIDMVGNTLRESVLWAREVDLYVTPHGTSQHKVGWLTDAPGIIYTTKSLARVTREHRPGSWEAEGISLPHHLFGEPVAAGTLRSVNDRRTSIDNVTLDGEALATLALTLIAERDAAQRSE